MMSIGSRQTATGLLLVLLMVLGACAQGGGENETAAEEDGSGSESESDASGDSESGSDGSWDPQLDPVEMAMVGSFFGNQASLQSGVRFYDDVGFEEEADTVISEETIQTLLSGSVWVAQDEASVIFNALSAGAGDLKIVGVSKDGEDWLLGHGPDVEGPDDIPGKKISGGAAGDPWISAARIILEDEYGLDPDEDVEWVSVSGGSDSRAQAIVAGQLDLAMVQPRHIATLEEAGGGILYNESREVANEMIVVENSTLQENRDSVCAYVEARLRGHQWATEGENNQENIDEIVELVEDQGVEVTDTDIEGFPEQAGDNWSHDLGASAEALDRTVEIFQGTGDLSEDFDWRDHVDFSCVHEAQEKLDLEKRPDPSALDA